MANLEQDIAGLQARVAKYEAELDAATTQEEKSELR